MMRVPIIDLEPWWCGGSGGRRQVADAVDAALRDVGFLLLFGHRIPPSAAERARAAAQAFFAMPAEAKSGCALTADAYRGWSGPGSQSNAASYGVDTPPDLKETLSVGPFGRPDDDYHRGGGAWFADNKLPADRPEIEAGLRCWYTEAERLSFELLAVMALALDLPTHVLQDQCRRPPSIFSVNWYPSFAAGAPEAGQFRAGPHTDFGSLTILDRQPGVGGLQVQDDDGAWHDAPFVPGALTVNVGDLMARWTGGRWRSTRHRVLAPPSTVPDEELVSLIFFHEPDYDAEIRPLCGGPSDDVVISGEYILGKIQALNVA
jgi:isopenicillin N synthase-like dioxygenase